MSPVNRQILIKLLVALLGSYLILLAIYWHESRDYALRQAGKLLKDALLTHHAIHTYVEESPRKTINALKERGILYKNFFAPELMSRTYAARRIKEMLNEERIKAGEPEVYFKLATDNPRNPVNRADVWESNLLARMNQENLHEYKEVKKSDDGVLKIYYAIPIDASNTSCLTCHGDPKDAPKELIDRYGDKAGFWEKSGNIRALISMRVPLKSYYQSANRIFAVLSLVTLLIFSVIFVAITYFIRRIDKQEQMLIESEKMASLGRLVAGFAHEINTPIGIAVGSSTHALEESQIICRMLDQEEVDEAELVRRLADIAQACTLSFNNLNRAAELVRSFKRTAVDQSRGEARSYNLRETIDDVVASLRDRLKRAPVTVTVTCPDTIQLYGRPGILDQILTNLINNSLQHGFENGARSGVISIVAHLDGEEVVLDYRDTGQGMPAKVVQKIFEPFFTTARESGGSGLGMFICYNLATSELRGVIRCASTPGVGTQFMLRYPAKTMPDTASPHD